MTESSNTPEAGLVCLVDDDRAFRESAAWWLEGLGYEVRTFEAPERCIEALSGDAAARAKACLMLDVRMPRMDGLQLLDALRERGVKRPVIFMTGHGDVPLAVRAMQKGAVTFLEKPFQESALGEALKLAFEEAEEEVAAEPHAPEPEGAAEYRRRFASLTARERQVMELVVAGDANKVIAFKLGISPKTVELHRSRIMSKMKAGSLTQLVRMAVSGAVETAAG